MSKLRKVAFPDLPAPKPYQGYRVPTVASYTGLSERSVYHACKTGTIRCVRIGSIVTIPGSEILRLLGQSA